MLINYLSELLMDSLQRQRPVPFFLMASIGWQLLGSCAVVVGALLLIRMRGIDLGSLFRCEPTPDYFLNLKIFYAITAALIMLVLVYVLWW